MLGGVPSIAIDDWRANTVYAGDFNEHHEVIEWFWSHYLGSASDSEVRNDWRFSPAKADDHSGLAPAYIATCSADPLRDEGNAYALQLSEAGVPVQHSLFEGQPHTLFQMFHVSEGAKDLIGECAMALKTALG